MLIQQRMSTFKHIRLKGYFWKWLQNYRISATLHTSSEGDNCIATGRPPDVALVVQNCVRTTCAHAHPHAHKLLFYGLGSEFWHRR